MAAIWSKLGLLCLETLCSIQGMLNCTASNMCVVLNDVLVIEAKYVNKD